MKNDGPHVRILQEMQKGGHGQKEIGELLDITVGTLSRKLNGHTEFRLSEGVRLANLFGVSIDSFFLPDPDG